MKTSKETLKEINETFKTLSQQTPKQMGGFRELLTGVGSASSLDKKTIELISISCAIVCGCESCIHYHVKRALDAGVTPQEIIESAWVGILMGGTPALLEAKNVLSALDEMID